MGITFQTTNMNIEYKTCRMDFKIREREREYSLYSIGSALGIPGISEKAKKGEIHILYALTKPQLVYIIVI